MNYSKQYLAELSAKTNFIKDNLEKVLRLAEILKFLNSDPVFKGKLALKVPTSRLLFKHFGVVQTTLSTVWSAGSTCTEKYLFTEFFTYKAWYRWT